MRVRLCPRSDMKEIPLLLIGPKVSKASGRKVYGSSRALYFVFLRSAAIPAAAAVAGKYEAARVSITVASHIRLRPACHGIKVRPSDRSKPGGSLMDGKPAFDRVQQIWAHNYERRICYTRFILYTGFNYTKY